MKWTEDQENSIYANPAQIIVSAAAGSGKTQVLTTRIIERIKDTKNPVSVENLLIVTFTKAAAAEMKERIGKALRKAAAETEDQEMRKYLKKQLMLLGSAHICTIDSFCYDTVKQNFFKANLPSDISIGENGELSLLKLAALEETVDILYCALEKEKGNVISEENIELAEKFEAVFESESERSLILKGFKQLTDSFSYDKKDSEFSEGEVYGGDYTNMISQLHKKSQSAAYPEKWINSIAEIYSDSTASSETLAYQFCFDFAKRTIHNALSMLRKMTEVSEANEIGYDNTFLNDIEIISVLSEAKDYGELYKKYISLPEFSALKPKKRGCDPMIAEELKNARNSVKDIFQKKLSLLLSFSPEDYEALRKLLYPQVKALCSATILLDRLYYEKMTARRIIDFSTCEHLALKIISEDGVHLSEAGEALKNKYDEIYIDEFQDSNNLQDILFSMISKGRTFVVGDVKQSIYGFRNADPEIFINRCEVSSFDKDAENRKIFLSKNFRSTKCIIDAVNSVFDTIMTSEAVNIDYKSQHRLDYGADFIPVSDSKEKCEITIIHKNGNAARQAYNEADYICKVIKDAVSNKRLVYDKETGKQRPVTYSDIAVLMRSPSSVSDVYNEAFANNGIPCYIDGGNDLYETSEVSQIIEILKLIDNSKSDISLASTLRSPMFMFDENELLKIKLAGKESFHESFYGVCSGKYPVQPELAKKCKNFMNQLNLWRKCSGFISVEELIRRIYADTNIYSCTLAMHDGIMRKANLDLLLEKADEFERSSYTGLFNFVTYVQKMKRTSDNISEAKSMSEKMDVVRIMSIHKSKGLEFPIVFLSNCAKAYHGVSASTGGLIISQNAGLGFNYVNPVLRYKYCSPIQQSLMVMAQNDDRAEEMRLLYVALTRAKEKLYIVATLKDSDAFYSQGYSFAEKLTSNEILGCNNYISLISLAYAHGADKFWKVNEVIPSEEECEGTKTICSPVPFKEDKAVSKLLDFTYPYYDYTSLPVKASVSLLKSLDVNLAPSDNGDIPLIGVPSTKKVTFSKPEFLNGERSGAYKGTVHHKFLQYFDYNGPSVDEQITTMQQKGILTEDEVLVLERDKIADFITSDLGDMLKKAKRIYREEAFVINISASEIDKAFEENETICVQGIIDCYFIKDDGSIVLIDYKTDKYNDPQEVVRKYKKQLYYYEKALKLKFKENLIQKYLYLMHNNDIIEIVT